MKKKKIIEVISETHWELRIAFWIGRMLVDVSQRIKTISKMTILSLMDRSDAICLCYWLVNCTSGTSLSCRVRQSNICPALNFILWRACFVIRVCVLAAFSLCAQPIHTLTHVRRLECSSAVCALSCEYTYEASRLYTDPSIHVLAASARFCAASNSHSLYMYASILRTFWVLSVFHGGLANALFLSLSFTHTFLNTLFLGSVAIAIRSRAVKFSQQWQSLLIYITYDVCIECVSWLLAFHELHCNSTTWRIEHLKAYKYRMRNHSYVCVCWVLLIHAELPLLTQLRHAHCECRYLCEIHKHCS